MGAYADKSGNYSPQDFFGQFAFATSFARRYNWIYGHGSAWWRLSDAEVRKYKGQKRDGTPVDACLDAYKHVVETKPRVRDAGLQEKARDFRKNNLMSIVEYLGIIDQWRVLGPFESVELPPGRYTGFETEWIDTSLNRFPTTMETKDGRRLTWKTCAANPFSGIVDPSPLWDKRENMTYYALCYVQCPTERAAELRMGTNDAGALWVNGRKIYEANHSRRAELDENIIDIVLPAGISPILAQVCQGDGPTGLLVRVTDEHGYLYKDVSFTIQP